ncbi:FtsW/RodA/SpoVE family cell cycle protein [Clostridium lundense]|uniref:FtsW/RodA/SpoVE family cell cycle protein n=1 Tax=Clostridium lundense TaxID=319475 RepID=UPI000480A34C|nr:FtsW/RodA/SpoVE family cell cycle protein [Clostridium lundense]
MGIKENRIVEEYIDNVLSEIKNKEVHEEIRMEITGHIEDLYETYLEEGLTSEEAIKKAILEMGEAKLIGEKLNKIHKGKIEWGIVIPSIIMCCFGIFLMFFMMDYNRYFNKTMGIKTVVWWIIGLTFAVILYKFDYRRIKKHCTKIFVGANLIVFFQLFFGSTINGVRIFIKIGSFSMNITSLYLFLMCIALPGVLEKIKLKKNKQIFYLIAVYAIPSFLIMLMPSMADLIIYNAIFIAVAINSGFSWRYVIPMPMVVISAIIIKIINFSYARKRFMCFLNFNSDPNGMGYINKHIDNLIKLSGLFGNGIDNNIQILPEAHTDFIFMCIVYGCGWIVAITLIALVVFFLVRLIKSSKLIKDSYGKLIVIAFTTLFIIEFSWNILMNLNLMPIMGVGCPFISYGGTTMVINTASIGLIMSIYRRKSYSVINA